jgi:hypothetical protein
LCRHRCRLQQRCAEPGSGRADAGGHRLIPASCSPSVPLIRDSIEVAEKQFPRFPCRPACRGRATMRWVAESRVEGPYIRSEESASGPCLSSLPDTCSPYRDAPSNEDTTSSTGRPMARRSESADLPLHSGQVPKWLADRMTRLGAVISEPIVHHYGRDQLLRRLAHPFWFQSFGAVMGMHWHSPGITTSVIGALKPRAARGRTRDPRLRRPRQAFTADSPGAGLDRRASGFGWVSAGKGEPARREGRQRRRGTASIFICTASSLPMTAGGSWFNKG